MEVSSSMIAEIQQSGDSHSLPEVKRQFIYVSTSIIMICISIRGCLPCVGRLVEVIYGREATSPSPGSSEQEENY